MIGFNSSVEWIISREIISLQTISNGKDNIHGSGTVSVKWDCSLYKTNALEDLDGMRYVLLHFYTRLKYLRYL